MFFILGLAFWFAQAMIFDSYRLHPISRSADRDRYTLTAHMAEVDRERWEIWF